MHIKIPFYGHVICEIILRVICVLYDLDEYRLLNTIIVNGYRVFLDRSRGKVGKNVPTDFVAEPMHVKPIYDSGILNVYYAK